MNQLEESLTSNYYQYMYTYIGGGVAAADFNNDGWDDLFFISNTAGHKLFLNKTAENNALQFEDVTTKAGITESTGFAAGVAVADVNADGYLDIYISQGGWIEDQFANQLFINNGDLTFTERADAFGLADKNRSITSTFFDCDNDGDLDVYIANAPDFQDKEAEVADLVQAQTDPSTQAKKGSDKLYKNDGSGHFVDASVSSGILPDIGFGLNPQVGDLNQDGWLDIYVCNDFRIPDFVYLNNQDGTFSEGRNDVLKHMSFNSMGGDIGDINNDGLMDVYTLDMNPEDYVRSKTTMAMTPVDRFAEMVDKDYHHQYMHNMLQINNGDATYREIANLAGVANTDWSWACLLADFNLDGFNDIFVTNGVFRDVIDRDANNEILALLRSNQRKPTDEDFLTYTKMLPQQKLANYFFSNNGDFTFSNVSSTWTDSIPSFSNGAAYSDLDNDGDLDLVINNINEEATLLKNNAAERGQGNFLQVILNGPSQNSFGVGALVTAKLSDGSTLIRQHIASRGFLSSVSAKIHFGLSPLTTIEALTIRWPDGKEQIIPSPRINSTITCEYGDANSPLPSSSATNPKPALFSTQAFDFRHEDPSFDDYQLQILLPHKLSQTGPATAVGDVNQDGIDDLYLGGGHGQAGQLLLGTAEEKFVVKASPDFLRDKQREDVGAAFFDLDGDGDEDLYVVSGSYEFPTQSRLLMDRLYLNDGDGNFTKSLEILPQAAAAGSIVKPHDYDQDGDLDLFVGGRVVSSQYPVPAACLLLINEDGRLTNRTDQLAPGLARCGMVTDAIWCDIDADEDADLLVTGEWMGLEVWLNENGTLSRSELHGDLAATTGWWNRLRVADTDNDGDQDIVAGNLGLNYKLHASLQKPLHVYTNDFDYNGTVDVILAKYYQGDEVPVRGKTCATQQLPHLAQKIPTYEEFAHSDLESIIGPGINSALHYTAVEFRSGIFINEGQGSFVFTPFDNVVQQSPVTGILYEDFDRDDHKDLLLAGNNHMSEIETTRSDAGVGVFLKGDGKGSFVSRSSAETGFKADGDVRNLQLVGPRTVLVINNNDQHELFRVRK